MRRELPNVRRNHARTSMVMTSSGLDGWYSSISSSRFVQPLISLWKWALLTPNRCVPSQRNCSNISAGKLR